MYEEDSVHEDGDDSVGMYDYLDDPGLEQAAALARIGCRAGANCSC